MRYIVSTVLMAVTFAGGPSVAQNQNDIIATFGDFRIERVQTNNSFMLVGVGTVSNFADPGASTRYFQVQCFAESPTFALYFPIYDAKVKEQKAIVVDFWNDAGARGSMITANFKDAVAVGSTAMVTPEYYRPFVDALRKAPKWFAWSFAGKSVKYATEDLPAAFSSFAAHCPTAAFDK